MSSNPFVDTNPDANEMTIEDAIASITCGTHFNFGSDVESRRRYYQRRSQAIAMVRQAGYAVIPAPQSFGHIVKPH
jgi:hypothetical protein